MRIAQVGSRKGVLPFLCRKNFDISSMGKSALSSHAKGKKHLINKDRSTCNNNHLEIYMNKSSSSKTPSDSACAVIHNEEQSICVVDKPHSKNSLSEYVSKSNVMTAEVWWALRMIDSNSSFSSKNNAGFVFQKMFTDSVIAKQFSLAETKSMYLSCFDIAPYLSTLLEKKLKQSNYVLLFDESLNKELQKKQLDIWVRIWDHDKVSSRYLSSEFLGHSCANDLLECFESTIDKKVGLSNLVQLSMDGPNVNWATFEKLNAKVFHDTGRKLIDVGSCGLHTIHNAFHSAVNATKWNLSDILYSLHRLFKDTPARRNDFESVTRQNVYPLKYCAHRWVENAKVCERVVQVLPHLRVYVESVEKKNVKDPATKSFETVKNFCKDPFAIAKLAFIKSVAEPVEIFLTEYQSDAPMLPFLAGQLEVLLRDTMKRFVKTDVLLNATSQSKLVSIDISDVANHKHTSRVDVGFAAQNELKNLNKDKHVSERSVLEFKGSCKTLLVTLASKLVAKSPLCKSVVRKVSCIDPNEIIKNPQQSIEKFKGILSLLITDGHIPIQDGDQIQRQFEHFVEEKMYDERFTTFSKDIARLDVLYFSVMNNEKMYDKLWPVVSKLLLLSHGQATVERGFSTNKEVTEQNLSEKNLIARRVIKDHIFHIDGLKNFEVSNELLQSVQCARHKYISYLEKQKKDVQSQGSADKRKFLEEEVEHLKKKRKQIEKDVEILNESADKNMRLAEEKQNLSFVSKANALRNKAKEKLEDSKSLEKLLGEKNKMLSNM